MQTHQFNLMIVDDIEDNRAMLEMMLEDQYDLSFAASGQECLDRLDESEPDLILLDITMPDMDGLEVCRRVAKMKPSIPIIFVSALVSAEERLAGFEAGGDEYITKPVCEQELFEKLGVSLEAREENLKLQVSANDAMNIAMEAMVSSSELGMLNQFMRDSAKAHSYAELADALLEIIHHFGLNCCIQFRIGSEIFNFECEPDSLEAKLLLKFEHGEKFHDFGARTMVNSERAGILLKNMPVDDEVKYGRLRDHMSVLIDAVDSKIIALQVMLDLDRHRETMVAQIIENNDVQLKEIQAMIANRDNNTMQIVRQVITKVESSLFSLGLEDDQERRLMAMLELGLDQLENLPDFSEEIAFSYAHAREALISLLKS